jgi:hypothetical protein
MGKELAEKVQIRIGEIIIVRLDQLVEVELGHSGRTHHLEGGEILVYVHVVVVAVL